MGVNEIYKILADVIELEMLLTARVGDNLKDVGDVVVFESEFRPRLEKLSKTYALLKGDPSVKLDV